MLGQFLVYMQGGAEPITVLFEGTLQDFRGALQRRRDINGLVLVTIFGDENVLINAFCIAGVTGPNKPDLLKGKMTDDR